MNLLSSIRAALERAFGIAWDWPRRHDNIYESYMHLKRRYSSVLGLHFLSGNYNNRYQSNPSRGSDKLKYHCVKDCFG